MQELYQEQALPYELIWRISHFLTCSPSSNDEELLESDYPDFSKPPWSDVEGFSMSSKALRTMVFRNWFRVLHVRNNDDWEVYTKKYPFVFKITVSVQWHGSVGTGVWLRVARDFFHKFTGLQSIRFLRVPGDLHFDLVDQPAFADYMKTLPRSLKHLEIINCTYPYPWFSQFDADVVPEWRVLRMKQPHVWCSVCFFYSIPHFARPFPVGRRFVYGDGRGLPVLWADHFAGLSKLHTAIIAAGIERGVRPFDEQNVYSWSGECERCLLRMDNDAIFREAYLETKTNNKHVPPNLRRVEWHFLPMPEF